MQVVQAARASTILFNLLESRGDKAPWLIPANICPIVPITFMKARVPFELVDISPDTLGMSLDLAREALGGARHGGLLYSHTYGDEATPEEFFAEAKRRDPALLVIDDRCLCVPGVEPRETAADVTLYSTGYSKVVDFGAGGFAFVAEEVAYRARELPFDRHDLEAVEAGYKRALAARVPYEYEDSDWLDAGGGRPPWSEQAKRIREALGAALEHRAALNAVYSRRLPAAVQLAPRYQTWRFNVRVPRRHRALEAIFAEGLFASAHFAALGGIMGPGEAPEASALAADVLNLFNDHRFDAARAARACDLVLEAIR